MKYIIRVNRKDITTTTTSFDKAVEIATALAEKTGETATIEEQ